MSLTEFLAMPLSARVDWCHAIARDSDLRALMLAADLSAKIEISEAMRSAQARQVAIDDRAAEDARFASHQAWLAGRR